MLYIQVAGAYLVEWGQVTEINTLYNIFCSNKWHETQVYCARYFKTIYDNV